MLQIKRILACAAVAAFSLSVNAQSVHDSSQASALSAAGLSAAVAFVPLSVTIGGSALSAMTMEHLSRLLAEETTWIVEQVTGKGARTELKLRATKQQAVMIVGVPTKQVINNNVTVNNQVHFDQLGTNSFALKYQEKTIGVMAPAGGNLGHSVQK